MNSPLNPHSPQNDLSVILLIMTILTGASQPFVFFVLRILYLDLQPILKLSYLFSQCIDYVFSTYLLLALCHVCMH